MELIRNFSIIAHIDHGKSTLADRMLELCGAVDPREMRDQYLDSMDLERERGITIKLQSVRLNHADHVLNLIDTPGHVDFGYEVSRSLAACEGVILLVDAAQGIEAQTLANCYLALENDLEIVAALNKIDLPAADPDRYAAEIEKVLGIPAGEILRISAKTGEGVGDLLDAVIERVPPPTGDESSPAITHGCSEGAVPTELDERLREGNLVAGWDEQARDPVLDDLRVAAVRRRHDGEAAAHCLQYRQREGFGTRRGHRVDVRQSVVSRQLIVRDTAGHDDPVAEARRQLLDLASISLLNAARDGACPPPGLRLHVEVAPMRTDEDEAGIGYVGQRDLERAEKVGCPLLGGEHTDVHNDGPPAEVVAGSKL